MKDIIIATKNKNKYEEIVHIIQRHSGRVHSLLFADDIIGIPEVIEDGKTLYENALKKAKETAEYTGKACLADDTGFFVRALGNKPGIHAARYAGEGCTYEDNVNKLLSEMKDKTETYAYFQTVCVLYDPTDESIISSDGILEGHIITEKRGINGFGYDPIFLPLGSEYTLAEMSDEEKNMISHRYKAIKNIKWRKDDKPTNI